MSKATQEGTKVVKLDERRAGRIDVVEPGPRDVEDHEGKSKKRKYLYAEDVEGKVIPEVDWIVRDFIPMGSVLLAGLPKAGKSWLALDLCVSVSTGTTVLGDRECKEGAALYISLEDNEGRFLRRLDKVKDGRKLTGRKLTYAFDWSRLAAPGSKAKHHPVAEDIREWAQEQDDPRLVIIDHFECVRHDTKRTYKKDQDDTLIFTGLARDLGIGIILIHHERKQEGSSGILRVSGTNGIAGAVDAVINLAKPNTDRPEGMIEISGRDVDDAISAAEFNKTNGRWTWLDTDLRTVGMSKERREIFYAIKGGHSKPVDIATHLKLDNKVVQKHLERMGGVINRVGHGQYEVKDHA